MTPDPTPDAERWRLLELAERSLDGKLSADEGEKLEQMLKEDASLRELFARALHQHAELRFDRSLLRDLAEERPSASAGVFPMPSLVPKRRSYFALPLAAAACAVLGGAAIYFMRDSLPPSANGSATVKTIATLTKASHCKWAGSTLPTAEGSRISAGTLELAEGIATVKFDSGAEVVMEAPASMELLDAMNCRLLRGTLVADVPDQAKGFTVDTPDAKVVDYGTRFGVSTGEDGKYLVKVLQGLVEVNPKAGGEMKKLRGGESMDNGLRKSQLTPQTGEQESYRWQPNTILDAGDGWQIVSTAYGEGKDTYVQKSTRNKNFGKDPYFRVKRSSFADNLNRVGYISFDVAKFKHDSIEDAEIILSIEPSDLGFATLVPDSTFTIYGLTDETGDAWEEHGLVWDDALGKDPFSPNACVPDPSRSVKLGSFKVAQGISHGTRMVSGSSIADFVRGDTNGIVTFFVIRETDESAKDGLAHAFATKESSHNTPPLLRVKIKE